MHLEAGGTKNADVFSAKEPTGLTLTAPAFEDAHS